MLSFKGKYCMHDVQKTYSSYSIQTVLLNIFYYKGTDDKINVISNIGRQIN